MALEKRPFLLYSDGKGNVYEDKTLYATGRSGFQSVEIPLEDWIELPDGGNLYELPGRTGLGLDTKSGEIRESRKGWAVAAFIPPAHTGLYLASYTKSETAPVLPLFCYTAVGWLEGKYYVPAVRIEQDIRQECGGFNENTVLNGIEKFKSKFPDNRIVSHLSENCALTYNCPAARNYFMGRWECPVPTSPACNSNCIGCISLLDDQDPIRSSHDRLSFKPSADEITEYTVEHLLNAPFPIISFGQGCEGEPLLMWETLKEAIIMIRSITDKGSININTNGSKPEWVKALCEAGLNSIRVSTNSAQKEIYTKYYRPNNYKFEDILESIKIVNDFGGWTSINYFVFPGVTDTVSEYEALRKLISETGLKMIQWRNFNIDPDWYLARLKITELPPSMGIKTMMHLLKEEFPNLKFGYFNPPMERITGNYDLDFAK
ncbi:MAG: radical SAM protein [Bacteroidota bacterium]|nr:radical SAM protein [Bacteroidota bacterium]